jgi:hypothetical protein
MITNKRMRIQTNWEEIAKESLMYIICADLKENKIYAETVGIAKLNKPAHVIIIHEGKGEKLGKEYYDNITEKEILQKYEEKCQQLWMFMCETFQGVSEKIVEKKTQTTKIFELK